MRKIKVELTDTFAGEANYSWVKRVELEGKHNETTKQLVRRVKKELDYTGIRCKTYDYFDCIVIRPVGICHIIFITFEEA